jgi:Acyltransferase family
MDRGLLAADGRMSKVSWDWMMLAIIPYCLLWALIFIKREILGNPSPLPDWYEGLYAVCFTVFSVAILFLILAYFLRFKHSGSSILDPMQADAYGMFLVHYPIALWLQYWLFDYDLPAIVKAAIGFFTTVAFSWALTRALRQIPGAKKLL